MQRSDVDILVIGAGPAGSSAALAAAGQGLDVLLVERKQRVGMPVQCAEFIPAMLIRDLKLKPSFCVQKIKGMKTYVHSVLAKETRAPGFMINRDELDRLLAQAAQALGTRLITSTRAVDLTSEGSVVLKKSSGESITVNAKVIIGADGPRSKVRRWIGLPDNTLLPGVQKTFRLTRKMECTHIYLDPKYYGGYAWLFPKGDKANVGLGVKRHSGENKGPSQLLSEFADLLEKQGLISGGPIAEQAGWIPVKPLRQAVYKNVLLAGDSAGHTHPITGAGIFSAVTCGRMAGFWAARAVLQNDLSLLKEYDLEWKDMFSRSLSHAHDRRQQMENQWHDFNRMIQSWWVAFGEYYA